MNEIARFKCKICLEVYTDPIYLTCCGELVCRSHLSKLLWDESTITTLACPVCKQSLPKQRFKVIEPIQVLIEDAKEKKRNDPEYQLSSFKQRVQDIEAFNKNSERTIHEKYIELKRKLNLDRENFKLEIDRLADEMMTKLDSYENNAMFASECYNELIKDTKCRLNEYEKFLVSLASTDEDRKSKRVEMEKEIVSLDTKIRDNSDKSITYESIDDEIKKLFGKLVVSIA